MKKLKKYATDTDQATGALNLKAYIQQSKSILITNKSSDFFRKKSIPLAGLVPLVAASLAPVAASAQCGVAIFAPSNSVNANLAGNGTDMTIDVDGDGTVDFEIDVALGTAGGGSPLLGDLFIHPENGAEVLCYAVGGGYFYTTKFNTNDAITSAGTVWKTGGSLNGGQATMDYQTNGPWHAAGPVTGFLGIRIDGNKLGFIEVTYETGVNVTINAALTGVQNTLNSTTTSINAGACAPLPVELSRFTAKANEGLASLAWTTESEINNEGFEIQRSTNGKDFIKTGWVEGQGNTTSSIDYTYTDEISLNTQYYYRLKQVDYDGDFSFSELRSVIFKDAEGLVLHPISPNPVSGPQVDITISAGIDQLLSLHVFDALGRLVLTKDVSVSEGTNSIDLSVESLSNGSYFLKLNGTTSASFKKMIIAR